MERAIVRDPPCHIAEELNLAPCGSNRVRRENPLDALSAGRGRERACERARSGVGTHLTDELLDIDYTEAATKGGIKQNAKLRVVCAFLDKDAKYSEGCVQLVLMHEVDLHGVVLTVYAVFRRRVEMHLQHVVGNATISYTAATFVRHLASKHEIVGRRRIMHLRRSVRRDLQVKLAVRRPCAHLLYVDGRLILASLACVESGAHNIAPLVRPCR